MLFDVPRRLPYSHGGVHLLEDRGSAWHHFTNASGGGYRTRYADFIAATQGRVEAVSVAVNRWRPTGGLRLCVGVRKPKRSHHALQLNVDQCEWDDEKQAWRIYHDGGMSRVRRGVVMEAVREAQAGRWIDTYDDGREWIYLGALADADRANWRNSRELLANLIHYASSGRICARSRSRLSVPFDDDVNDVARSSPFHHSVKRRPRRSFLVSTAIRNRGSEGFRRRQGLTHTCPSRGPDHRSIGSVRVLQNRNRFEFFG